MLNPAAIAAKSKIKRVATAENFALPVTREINQKTDRLVKKAQTTDTKGKTVSDETPNNRAGMETV